MARVCGIRVDLPSRVNESCTSLRATHRVSPLECDAMDIATFVRIYLIIAGVAVGSALLEGVVLSFSGRRDYDWKGSMISLAIAVGRRIADFVPALLA